MIFTSYFLKVDLFSQSLAICVSLLITICASISAEFSDPSYESTICQLLRRINKKQSSMMEFFISQPQIHSRPQVKIPLPFQSLPLSHKDPHSSPSLFNCHAYCFCGTLDLNCSKPGVNLSKSMLLISNDSPLLEHQKMEGSRVVENRALLLQKEGGSSVLCKEVYALEKQR